MLAMHLQMQCITIDCVLRNSISLIVPRILSSTLHSGKNKYGESFFRHMEKNAIRETTDSGVIGVAPCRHFRRGR